LFSCSKKEESIAGNSVQSAATSLPSNELNSVSDWMTLPFTMAPKNQPYYLEGTYNLVSSSGYDYTKHHQLVFVKIQGRDSYVYKALPCQIPDFDGTLGFSFKANERGVIVKVMNMEHPNRKPDLRNYFISTSKFRFLVISDSTFRAHNIDWTNYEAVAAALRSSIRFE
jgi:hypothetical protein